MRVVVDCPEAWIPAWRRTFLVEERHEGHRPLHAQLERRKCHHQQRMSLDRRRQRRHARGRHLGIPFQVMDLSVEYKERIVDYMFDEYAAGRTPNPDVLCNREVKFDLFLTPP